MFAELAQAVYSHKGIRLARVLSLLTHVNISAKFNKLSGVRFSLPAMGKDSLTDALSCCTMPAPPGAANHQAV